MSKTFESLKFADYRLWFLGGIVSNTGVWMQRVAQDWLVLRVLTDNSGTAVGITTALQFLPTLLFGPWAGLLADRVDKRKLLMATQVASFLLALSLGILVITEHAHLWQVYVFAFTLGVVSTLDNPARQTFVAELVPISSLANAVGLNSASFNAARLIGPAVAGATIAVYGSGGVFIINSVAFLVPLGALFAIRRREKAAEDPQINVGNENVKPRIRDGLIYVRGRSDIIVIMMVVSVVAAFGFNFQLTSAIMATEVFHKGPGEYGLLGSFMAIGTLTGALLAARRSNPRVRTVVVGAFLFGVAEFFLALAPSYWAFALLSIPVGVFSLTMITSASAAVQLSTEPQMRGRVMALYMMVFLGTTPVGAPLVGWISETYGGRVGLLVGAVASLLVASVAGLWAKRHWNVEITYRARIFPVGSVGPRERAHEEDPFKDPGPDVQPR